MYEVLVVAERLKMKVEEKVKVDVEAQRHVEAATTASPMSQTGNFKTLEAFID